MKSADIFITAPSISHRKSQMLYVSGVPVLACIAADDADNLSDKW